VSDSKLTKGPWVGSVGVCRCEEKDPCVGSAVRKEELDRVSIGSCVDRCVSPNLNQ